MSDVNRRDMVKFAAALAVGAAAGAPAVGQEPKKPADPAPLDAQLERAANSLLGLMIHEQATSQIKGGGPGYALYVTSARGSDGTPGRVAVRSGAVAVFRADPSRDEFTRQGGFYWECGGERGKVQFKKGSALNGDRGPLVMAVRESDGTVRWYSLVADYRC